MKFHRHAIACAPFASAELSLEEVEVLLDLVRRLPANLLAVSASTRN